MRRSLSFLAILGLVGCGSFDPSYVTDPAPSISDEVEFSQVDLIALLTPAAKSGTTRVAATDPKTFEAAFNAFYADTSDQALRRNRVQDRLIVASVASCKNYVHEINRFKSNADFLTKATAGGLSAAGALVTGGVSQIVSGAAGAVLALGETVNETYLQNLTLSLIVKAIEARRNEIELGIKKSQTATIKDYTVESAVADALRYHNACSLLTGLRKADQEVSSVKAKSENGLTLFLDKYGTDETSEKIDAWLGWDGKTYTNKGNEDTLTAWIKSKKIGDPSTTFFLSSPEFRTLRAKFIPKHLSP